jgi:hypothetical protein
MPTSKRMARIDTSLFQKVTYIFSCLAEQQQEEAVLSFCVNISR